MIDFKALRDKPKLSSKELKGIAEYIENFHYYWSELPEKTELNIADRTLLCFKFHTQKKISKSQDLLSDRIISLAKEGYTVLEVFGEYETCTKTVAILVWHPNEKAEYTKLDK